MNNSELQLKLQKTRKVHGAQIEILKQKLSAVNAELQALQTVLHCELVEIEESLNRAERDRRSVASASGSTTFASTEREPNFQNGNGAERADRVIVSANANPKTSGSRSLPVPVESGFYPVFLEVEPGSYER